MTLQQLEALLAQVEAIHALTAEGVLSLRERIQNEGKYTAVALAELDKRLAERVGTAQKLADQVADYRVHASNIGR